MNRRSFIATLTALAGVALAKIKAPVTNVVRRRHDRILALAGEQIRAGDAVYIKDGKMYKCPTETFKPWPPGTRLTYIQTPDGKYRWVPVDNP